ncbi:hypothetical protein DFH06DRAFT_1350076 [Mycena polygramma]|nr:hypothetical protein DFH06DRAFT_1350076 [Mycena polygramma]
MRHVITAPVVIRAQQPVEQWQRAVIGVHFILTRNPPADDGARTFVAVLPDGDRFEFSWWILCEWCEIWTPEGLLLAQHLFVELSATGISLVTLVLILMFATLTGAARFLPRPTLVLA